MTLAELRRVIHLRREEELKLPAAEVSDRGLLESAVRHFRSVYQRYEPWREEEAPPLPPLPTLSPEDGRALAAVVRLEEVDDVIRLLPRGKAPGTDGLPYEFYVACWEILRPVLTRVFKCIFTSGGTLTLSQRTAVISLIPKKGRPETFNDLRPIALLNCGYRILTRF
jgi:hypothetical protein